LHTGTQERRLNACSIWNYCDGSIMEIKLPQDFKEFLRLLHSHRVNYLLVGGYAVGYYGYPKIA
jgi:hypothetical protein